MLQKSTLYIEVKVFKLLNTVFCETFSWITGSGLSGSWEWDGTEQEGKAG